MITKQMVACLVSGALTSILGSGCSSAVSTNAAKGAVAANMGKPTLLASAAAQTGQSKGAATQPFLFSTRILFPVWSLTKNKGAPVPSFPRTLARKAAGKNDLAQKVSSKTLAATRAGFGPHPLFSTRVLFPVWSLVNIPQIEPPSSRPALSRPASLPPTDRAEFTGRIVGDKQHLGSFLVTAYTQYHNPPMRTASGTMPELERTVAVDPTVIPIGSKVHIEGIGTRIAEDTGRLIKGKRLDLYLSSIKRCMQFGARRHQVHVFIEHPDPVQFAVHRKQRIRVLRRR